MIVGSYFDGDDDDVVAWTQHDVYGEALWIICSTCNRYAEFAKNLMGDRTRQDWGTVTQFDHRTLQCGHDLLAAAWRFRHEFRQGRFVFDDSEVPVSPASAWLQWLRAEVADWIQHPDLVRWVLTILAHQNQPAGYHAEAKLGLAIMDRFHDVPWSTDLHTAYELDLSRESQRLVRPNSETEE